MKRASRTKAIIAIPHFLQKVFTRYISWCIIFILIFLVAQVVDGTWGLTFRFGGEGMGRKKSNGVVMVIRRGGVSR